MNDYTEEETKFDIEEASVNLNYMKKEELSEEGTDLEESSHTKQYKISLKHENIFGDLSHIRKFEEDEDNLIGFLHDDAIMEDAVIKLEVVKKENINFNFHCNNCKGFYKGYCLKCSTLSHILNNASPVANLEPELNNIPIDILEIREISLRKGVYVLKSLPKNIIFGPFEGISAIKTTDMKYHWKIKDKILVNIENGNWMKNICANASSNNLDIFQNDGNLYFRTNREIMEGEELLVYYDDEKIQSSNDSEECYLVPHVEHKLPRIFACTLCCLGFGLDKCLVEHKSKCSHRTDNRKDFEFIKCQYCKIWLEKWEHEEYHMAFCWDKYHRMWPDHSKPTVKSEINVDEITDLTEFSDDRSYSDMDELLQKVTKKSIAEHHHEIHSEIYNSDGDLETHMQNRRGKCSPKATQYINSHNDIQLYQCRVCRTKFSTIYSLTEHTRNKHALRAAKNEFEPAEYCTNQRNNLSKHVLKHRGIKAIQCDMCMKKFAGTGSLNRHIKVHHTKDGSIKNYKCPECCFQTDYKWNLQTHLNMHKKRFGCDSCTTKFPSKYLLEMHIKNKHTNSGNAKHYQCSECCFQTNSKYYLQGHLNAHNGIKPFQCDLCTMKFYRKNTLTAHMKNKHIKVGNYKCSQCSFQTNYEHSLKYHLCTHITDKAFECNICMIKFTVKESLKRHIKNEHSEDKNVYVCSQCSYQTNYKYNLQKHLVTHSDVKSFQCTVCTAKFALKHHLTRHVKNKHTENAKDHKCSKCSYRTSTKANLRKHLDTHGDIKPYHCDICLMKFAKTSNLKIHIKNKHTENRSAKDYKCPECSFQTDYKGNLTVHLTRHIKQFQCDICMTKFTTKTNLKAHVKEIHTKDGTKKD